MQHLAAYAPMPRRPVLVRAFQYWSNVDSDLGKKIEEAVRSQKGAEVPTTGQTPAAPGSEAADKPEHA